jgi:mannose-6-phosphate isomerase-like protein (cupin superfamily)
VTGSRKESHVIEGVDYTRVSWDGLEDFPSPTGEDLTLRVYSMPLGCEHLAISIGKLEPGESCDHHQHRECEEVYILARGRSEIRIGDGSLEAKPMDAFRIPAGVDHSVYNNSDDTCWWIFMCAPNDEFLEYFDPNYRRRQ